MINSQQRDHFRELFDDARTTGQLEAMVRRVDRESRRNGDGALCQVAGLALADLGFASLGRPLLETAQTIEPLTPESELVLGQCCQRSGETELAILLLQNAGFRDGASSAIRLKSAEALGEMDQLRLAWMICRRAVQESPDEDRAWFLLSYFMGQVGCPFSRIEIAARHAIRLAPDVVDYRISFASTLIAVGRSWQAFCLVNHFSRGQLDQVNCRCCVERLLAIYEQADDTLRSSLCRQRLDQLDAGSQREVSSTDWSGGDVI